MSRIRMLSRSVACPGWRPPLGRVQACAGAEEPGRRGMAAREVETEWRGGTMRTQAPRLFMPTAGDDAALPSFGVVLTCARSMYIATGGRPSPTIESVLAALYVVQRESVVHARRDLRVRFVLRRRARNTSACLGG